MGKQIHLRDIEALFEKSPVVDFKSIERRVKQKSKNYAKLLVFNLLKNKKINKLCKGYYTKHNEISLSVFCFKPAYLGLQSALSFYNLWEQETIPVILSAKKVRRGIRKVIGNNILVRNLDAKYFFGFEYCQEGEFYLPYSDIEKTYIDMLWYHQYLDTEIVKQVKKRMDYKKLNAYLKRYPKVFAKKAKEKLK